MSCHQILQSPEFEASAVIAAIIGGLVSVVCGLLTALVTLRTSERKIQIENITKERAAWREKIRSAAVEVLKAWEAENQDSKDQKTLSELQLIFAVNLNPLHEEDRSIIKVIENLRKLKGREQDILEFSDRLTLLLKHDWERSKREAKPWLFRTFSFPARRVPYANFKKRTTRP